MECIGPRAEAIITNLREFVDASALSALSALEVPATRQKESETGVVGRNGQIDKAVRASGAVVDIGNSGPRHDMSCSPSLSRS